MSERQARARVNRKLSKREVVRCVDASGTSRLSVGMVFTVACRQGECIGLREMESRQAEWYAWRFEPL